jgi:hypothetical protein
VRLAPHLHGLERDDVEDNTICGEQHIETALEVFLGQLVRKVADVQSAMPLAQHSAGWSCM